MGQGISAYQASLFGDALRRDLGVMYALDDLFQPEGALKEAMDRLSDREKRILNLRFFEGKTQMEVSARIGISQAQISRLEKNAIQKIKRDL